MSRNVLDLQVNGYLGIDFSSESLDEKSLHYAVDEYSKRNNADFLPTLITSDRRIYRKNLAFFANFIKEREHSSPIAGLHLEGPFISSAPGAVGAHNPAFTSLPDVSYLHELHEWSDGNIRLLTIAAELPGADMLCKEAVKMGIAVSLGHQLAEYDDISRLYDAGAGCITHVGNGMPNLVDRHSNPLLAALVHSQISVMIIADGHHLPAHLVDGIVRLKGAEKCIVVSDAAPLAGLPPGKYVTLGNDVVLEASGKLHNPDKGCLVGSSFSIAGCIEYLKNRCRFTDEKIDQLCRENPRHLLSFKS